MESEVDRLSGMVDSLLKLTNLEQVPRSCLLYTSRCV